MNQLFVYRRLLMVGTKSRGYSNSGRLSEGKYSMSFLAPVPALLKSAYNSIIIGPRGLGW